MQSILRTQNVASYINHPWTGRLGLEVPGSVAPSVPGRLEVALEDGPRHEYFVARRTRQLLLGRLPNLRLSGFECSDVHYTG